MKASPQVSLPDPPQAGHGSGDDCLNAAYHFLASRPRSEAETRSHLRRHGFEAGPIEHALGRLKELRLIDDEAFARFWMENRAAFRPRSRAMLRQELARKGIAAATTSDVTAEVDDLAGARRAAESRMRAFAGLAPFELRRRLVAFLRRRGFSYDVSTQTAQQVCHESEVSSQDA